MSHKQSEPFLAELTFAHGGEIIITKKSLGSPCLLQSEIRSGVHKIGSYVNLAGVLFDSWLLDDFRFGHTQRDFTTHNAYLALQLAASGSNMRERKRNGPDSVTSLRRGESIIRCAE